MAETMPRLPTPPDISFDTDGYPTDLAFDDGYFSRSGGLDETNTVFLSACGLPERWAGANKFTIGELGFGTGLNFLALAKLWLDNRPADGWLHIVSFEAHPMEKADAERALQAYPTIAPLAAILLARWPVRALGVQRLTFDDWRMTLTLHVGPAARLLKGASFQADAWFLDGFAPARNPDMWSDEVLSHVARLSAPNCIAATYTAARAVRDGLATAGFDVERLPGHGHKKHRLRAQLNAVAAPSQGDIPQNEVKTAIVIGGGIAGAVTAASLASRGLKVTVIDPDPCGQHKASNNPAALVMPRLDRGDTPAARFHKAAWLVAADRYRQLPSDCFTPCAITERPRAERDQARMTDLIADPPLPASMLGHDEHGHFVHHAGGVIYPHALRRHLLLEMTVLNTPVQVVRLVEQGWQCVDESGGYIASADLCVVAAGQGIARLLDDLDLPLEARAGQLTLADFSARDPSDVLPVAGGAYALPFEQWLLFGATFDPWALDGAPPQVTNDAHTRNLASLASLSPSLAQAVDQTTMWGRASVRVAASDRLPLAGEVASGLYVIGALGSRGFSTTWLCAELVTSHALGEPLPLDQSTIDAVSPHRFARRLAKRTAKS